MPRQSLVSAPAPTAPDSSLKPPLQKALASLSVDLETELMRYRQSRKGSVAPPQPRGLSFRKRRKPIDLIQVQSTPETQLAPPLGVAESPPPLPPNPRLLQSAAATGSPLARIEPPLDSLESEVATPDAGDQQGSLAPYQAIPEDFLETTEALLRSTAEEQADPAPWDTHYTPSLMRRLSTPLGIGSLLLLLVSSAGLGYVLTNPNTLGHLWTHPTLQTLRGQPSEAEMAEGADAVGVFESGLEGLGPDLSQKEFVDLNRSALSTLPGAAPAPTIASTPLTGVGAPTLPTPAAGTPAASSPTAAPTATADAPPASPGRPPVTVPATVRPVQAPVAPTPAAPAPAAAVPARPAAPAAAPAQPQAAPPPPLPSVSPQPPVAAAPAAAPSYYVVTDYTGDQSLSQARSAVGEAYVRNFPAGARIQMGAFDQRSSAQDLVQQLQQQGISAEVYTPE